jgi:hypothetical protein
LEAEGVAGVAFTTTFVVPAAEEQPATVMITEYVPAFARVALSVGFCAAEVKPFGPLHAYVAPATVGVDKAIVPPSQYGPPLLATGVAGGVQAAQPPGPAVVSTKPLTVPLKRDDVVVPVVFTTTTNVESAGTVKE